MLDLVLGRSCCKNAVNVDLPFATLRPFGLFWAENGNDWMSGASFQSIFKQSSLEVRKTRKKHRFYHILAQIDQHFSTHFAKNDINARCFTVFPAPYKSAKQQIVSRLWLPCFLTVFFPQANLVGSLNSVAVYKWRATVGTQFSAKSQALGSRARQILL